MVPLQTHEDPQTDDEWIPEILVSSQGICSIRSVNADVDFGDSIREQQDATSVIGSIARSGSISSELVDVSIDSWPWEADIASLR
jgi:hypothetical protein